MNICTLHRKCNRVFYKSYQDNVYTLLHPYKFKINIPFKNKNLMHSHWGLICVVSVSLHAKNKTTIRHKNKNDYSSK